MSDRDDWQKTIKGCLVALLISLWLVGCGWAPDAGSGPGQDMTAPLVETIRDDQPPGGSPPRGVENIPTDFWVDVFRNDRRIAALMVPFIYRNQPKDALVLHLNRRHEKPPIVGFLLGTIDGIKPSRPSEKCLVALANGQPLEPRIQRITGDEDFYWEISWVPPAEVDEMRIELKKTLQFKMFFQNLEWNLTSGGCPAGRFRFDHFHRDALFASYQDPIEERAAAGDVLVIHQRAGAFREPVLGVRVLEVLDSGRGPFDAGRDLVLRTATSILPGQARQLTGDDEGQWEKIWKIDPVVRTLRLHVYADMRLQLVLWEGRIDWRQAESQIRAAELDRASTGLRQSESVMTAGRDKPCFP